MAIQWAPGDIPPTKLGPGLCLGWAEPSTLGPAPSQGDPVHTPGKRHTAGNTHPVTSCSV